MGIRSLLSRWLGHGGQPGVSKRKKSNRPTSSRLPAIEPLEERTMLSLSAISDVVMPEGQTFWVPLDGLNPDGESNTFEVEIDGTDITGEIVTGGTTLRVNVSGENGDGQSFTGDLYLRLFDDLAPDTVAQILELVEADFYDGLTFHRIIDDFMAQGGDPNGDGSGGSGTEFDDEYSVYTTFNGFGQLAMANSGDDTNSSQFFITDIDLGLDEDLVDPPQHLNFQHTIFGQLVSGFDVYSQLISTATDSDDAPTTTATINSVEIVTDNQNGLLRIDAPSGYTGTTTVTVTATSSSGVVTQDFSVEVIDDTQDDPPFLGAIADQETNEDVPLKFTIRATDIDDYSSLSFVVRDPDDFSVEPENVSIDINVTYTSTGAKATVTVVPDDDFVGTVQLLIGVTDGDVTDEQTDYDTQLITLTVNSKNDAPQPVETAVVVTNDEPGEIQLYANDGDPEVQVLTYEIVTGPSHGEISDFDAEDGTFTYTPTAGYVGTDTIEFRVKDDGGTEHGGVDTSPIAVLTLLVVDALPDTPTDLQLDPNSDDGVLNDDAYTSNEAPVIYVTADTGMRVDVLVNGVVVTTATESKGTPGRYSATLDNSMLQVGENVITTIAYNEAVGWEPEEDEEADEEEVEPVYPASEESEEFELVYAPSYTNVYTVPGEVGVDQEIVFNLGAGQGAYSNEIGYYIVDDSDGTVNGVSPGDATYARAVMNRAESLFTTNSTDAEPVTVTLQGGQMVAFYLISNSTSATFASTNSLNVYGQGPMAFFSVTDANPDGIIHSVPVADSTTGIVQYSWEDMFGGGDGDYNDVVLAIQPETAGDVTTSDAIRVPGGEDRDVTTNFALKVGKLSSLNEDSDDSPVVFDAELGIFIVDDASGTVNGVSPGDAAYAQAALNSDGQQTLFSVGDSATASTSITLPAGSLIGFYLIPGSSLADWLSENRNNTADESLPVVFLSFDAANSDGAEHFRWYSAEGVSMSPSDDGTMELHIMNTLFGDDSYFDAWVLEVRFG